MWKPNLPNTSTAFVYVISFLVDVRPGNHHFLDLGKAKQKQTKKPLLAVGENGGAGGRAGGVPNIH